MARTPLVLLALLALAVLPACKADAPPAAAPATSAAAAPGSAAQPAPPVPAVGGASTYVSSVTLLRREPSEARKVPGPAGKEVANVLATLQRGEKVTVDGEVKRVEDAEWVKVRSSDDHAGWIRRASLLEGEGIAEATVLAPADVFDRPDLLAANAGRKLEPGILLLVVRSRPPFSEVNVSAGPNAWVLSDRLATGAAEVSIAKLAEKARWLKRNGKAEEASQILAFARTQFPDAPLLDAVATQLGEPAAAEAGTAPAPAAGTNAP